MIARCHALSGQMTLAEDARDKYYALVENPIRINLTDLYDLFWRLPQPLPTRRPGHWGEGLHKFGTHTFTAPQWCDHCMQFIKPLTQGFRCMTCKMSVHSECNESVKGLLCWGCVKEEDPSLVTSPVYGISAIAARGASHVHKVKERVLHRPHWCDLCHKLIASTKAYKCGECPMLIHKGCLPPNTVVE